MLNKRHRDRLQLIRTALLAAVMGISMSVNAEDAPLNFDLYNFSAEAESEVVNDLWIIELEAREEGQQASAVADKVNASMGWATQQLKAWPTINSRTSYYNTQPQYERGGRKIIGWTVTQGLKLEIDDAATASTALQTLQERLQIRSMQPTVKPATRRAAVDELIADALEAFRARAQRISAAMGSSGYRIVDININTQGDVIQPERGMMMRSVTADAAMAAPSMEAGESRIGVQVHGRIQLD